MSVIQTIRNKYGKIAGAVIAIALIGFIISDARNGSFGSFFGGHDNAVMKVNGTKIDPKVYQQRLKEYETLNAVYNNTRTLDDAARAQMDEQVVQMVVYETVIGEQCDKLGIQVTKDEEKELIYGQMAHPMIRSFQFEGQKIFMNPETNQFDPQRVKYIDQQLADNPQKVEPTGKLKEQWETVKEYVKRMARIDKFNAMYSGAIYSPMYVAKRNAADQGSMAAIKYVKVPLTSIPDNDIKVTDEDIKAYMQQHAAMFETDQPTRTIEYVSFDINPSSADTARQVDALNEIKADFVTAKDDKVFVNNKSDEANSYSGAYVNKKTFMSRYADTLMGMPKGEVFGPYFENGSYRLTKIVDKETLPDSSKERHIIVMTKQGNQDVRTDSAAKMRIDSAIAMIKGGASFDSVVSMYSDDNNSKKTKGENTFTLAQRPAMPKEWGDFIFEGKKGESKTLKITKNDNYEGYQYVEIQDQTGIAPSVKFATIIKSLSPSDSTVNAIYGKANEFAGKNPTGPEFDAAIKKQNLDRRIGDNIKENSFAIQGLGASREIVRWAYEHKEGEVSGVFQLGDQRYVVAKLAGINEKGLMAITPANHAMLQQRVRDEKKVAAIGAKYKGAASLDAIASSTGQQVAQSDSVMLGGSFIPGLGYEPKVVGYTFCPTFQPNTVSPAIKGQGGVYFITVLNRTTAPANPNMMQMVMMQRSQQEGQLRNAVNQTLQQSVNKKADVQYNVSNF